MQVDSGFQGKDQWWVFWFTNSPLVSGYKNTDVIIFELNLDKDELKDVKFMEVKLEME